MLPRDHSLCCQGTTVYVAKGPQFMLPREHSLCCRVTTVYVAEGPQFTLPVDLSLYCLSLLYQMILIYSGRGHDKLLSAPGLSAD